MKYINKSAAVIASTVVTVLGGYSGIAFAHTSIDTQGPDSGVSVTENITTNCSLSNNNNVAVTNTTQQSAQTGNANVGGSWNAWNPSVWQSKGYSYEDWHAAFTSYMNNEWGNANGWFGGNTNAGNAVSGNASNESSNRMMLSILNGMGCGNGGLGHGGGTDVSTEGPHSGVGVVLGTYVNNANENNNRLTLSNNTGQNVATGDANVSGNTHAGSGVSGSSNNGYTTDSIVGIHNSPSGGSGSGSGSGTGGTSGGASISTAGPNSGVSYYSSNNSDTSMVNTNNITTIATVSQNAITGNASVSGNTSGGSAQTGDAMNTSTSWTNIVISN